MGALLLPQFTVFMLLLQAPQFTVCASRFARLRGALPSSLSVAHRCAALLDYNRSLHKDAGTVLEDLLLCVRTRVSKIPTRPPPSAEPLLKLEGCTELCGEVVALEHVLLAG